MGLHLERGGPEKPKGRATLTLPNPLFVSALGGGNFDEENIQEAALWGNALLRARDEWADLYRKRRRYSDEPVDRNRDSLGWQNGGRA
jgi:hypothetical protein